ncbi:MAG: MarR family transcriptional regulator [Oscillospiraceae bacterium]|nr:MarR family transcriptional regulator [Oscillospiraceae bacterium]
MIAQSAVELYKVLRLRNYQDMFGRIKEKDGSLSATEAFAVDVIYLLGSPTISDFAQTLGISQPNATYKANNLAQKGYIKKCVSEDDKREIRLTVADKFYNYFDTRVPFIAEAVNKLRQKYSSAEMSICEEVLGTFIHLLENTEA